MAKSTTYRRRERPYAQSERQHHAVDDKDGGWATTLMVVGLLSVIIVFWLVGTRTLISFNVLFRWFALFAFVGNLIPLKWLARKIKMDRLEWLWFNLLAVGPIAFNLCVLMNFFAHGPEQKMLVQGGRAFNLHAYWQEHRALPPHLPWPADFGADPEKARAAMATAKLDDKVYGLAEGLFGYLVITSEDRVTPAGELE
ncbi:MAG: hypothetical protein WAT61_00090 [Flavobacteriales bacterium]|jgi:hypothetical protein|nr:hypothetical protein [Flavobacteriales bacterium]MBP9159222.1 hypothetical protein [Flavobacteriales bacterium]